MRARSKVTQLRAVPPLASSAKIMVEATADVVEALERLSTDSSKMRVLAMASAVYGREPDAKWFLESASDAQKRGERCGRCGHLHGKTRAHW